MSGFCRGASLLVLTALISGCTVGPDFKRPTAPANAGFAPTTLPTQTVSAPGLDGEIQRLNSGQDVKWDWWTAFKSPELNALVEQALRANPTIESAKSALRQAQELVDAQKGYFFPTIGAGYTAERQKAAGNLSSNDPGLQGNGSSLSSPAPKPLFYNLHTVALTVGYSPDIFGANHRAVEAAEAQTDLQRFELEAAYTSLASNVVAAAIQEATLKAQLQATQDIIKVNRDALDILLNQQRQGFAMAIDVAGQESALAQAEQGLPPLQKQLAQTHDLLRALVGNLPNQDVTASFDLSTLQLPQDLPVSLPSKIIEQRPDVRAAEEQMRTANAELGSAIAARLPQFALTGSYGGVASQIDQLVYPGAGFWTLGANVTQTIFDGNTLFHKQQAANEALIQASAQYRGTVITAFQNVADSLHALLDDAESLKAAVRAEQAAKRTLEMTRRQQQAGYVNYLVLLTTEQAYQAAEINLVQARGSRFGDTVALFQALGGGWWNRPVVAMNDQPKE